MNFSAADRQAREVRARRKPLDIDEPISPPNPLAIGTYRASRPSDNRGTYRTGPRRTAGELWEVERPSAARTITSRRGVGVRCGRHHRRDHWLGGGRRDRTPMYSAFSPENAVPSRRRQPHDQSVPLTSASWNGDIAPISQAV